jgi:hypothetical protein
MITAFCSLGNLREAAALLAGMDTQCPAPAVLISAETDESLLMVANIGAWW